MVAWLVSVPDGTYLNNVRMMNKYLVAERNNNNFVAPFYEIRGTNPVIRSLEVERILRLEEQGIEFNCFLNNLRGQRGVKQPALT